MKRFLSICLLFVFISINTNLVQAIDVLATNSLSSQVIYRKANLQKIPSGAKYVKTIDSLVLKLEEKQDTEKLIAIKNKLEAIKLDSKATNTKALLDYILAKINLSLDNLSKIEIKTEAPNAEDKAKVEKEILLIQKQIYDTLLSLSNQTESELNKSINYEEKGSFSANIAANYALVGELKASLEANDYTVLNANFDSKVSSKLKGFFEAKKAGDEKAAKLEFSAFIDLIQKDENIYMLLKDLNIVDETGLAEIETYVEKLKDFAKENKYVKIQNYDSKEAIDLLKSIDIETIKADIKTISLNPLFELKGKKDDKYYLQPTKFACDKLKQAGENFDKTITCSDSDYKYLLSKYNSSVSAYISLGDTKNLVINYKEDSLNSELKMSFNSSKILTTDLILKEGNDYTSLNYIANKSLIGKFDADGININLNSTLDSSNSIKTADLNIKSRELNSNIKLENGNISGNTSIENIAKISHSGKYGENYFEMNNKIDVSNIYESQIQKARDSSRINDLYSLQSALEQSYQDKIEYPTKANFEEMISVYMYSSAEDPLKNVEINGCKFGYIYEVGTDENAIENQSYKLSTCLESNKEKLTNDEGTDNLRFELGNFSGLKTKEKFYINDYKTWNQKTSTIESSNYYGNLNFSADMRDNKNNSSFYADGFIGNQKVFDMTLKNTSTRVYKNGIKIEAPTNVIDVEDINF